MRNQGTTTVGNTFKVQSTLNICISHLNIDLKNAEQKIEIY